MSFCQKEGNSPVAPEKSSKGKTPEGSLVSSGKSIGSYAVSTVSKPLSLTQKGLTRSVSTFRNIPGNGIVSSSADLVGSVLRDAVPMVIKRSVSGSSGDESADDDDIVKSKYMMRSIAGLLGTASAYAGMESAQVINDITEQVSRDISSVKSELPSGHSHEHPPGRPLAERTPTLFEISVEPNTHLPKRDGDGTEVSPPDQASVKRAIEDTIMAEEASKYSIFKQLREKFRLTDEDIMVYDSTAWLLRDVLIQGYCFITLHHFLFFAYLPKADGKIQMTGNINLRSSIRGVSRYWAVLKDNLLSLYSSVTNVYFPLETIDLNEVTKLEMVAKVDDPKSFTNTFKVSTKDRTYVFVADSSMSARAWYNTIKRQQFASKNSGKNYISLKIPLRNILELDDEEIINQSVTLVVRATESQSSYTIDDYIFMFLDSSGSLIKEKLVNQLHELVKNGEAISYSESRHSTISDLASIDAQLAGTEVIDGEPTQQSPTPNSPNIAITKSPSPSIESDLSEPVKFPSSEKKGSTLLRPIAKINRLRSKSGDWIQHSRPVSFLLNRSRDDSNVEESVVMDEDEKLPTTEYTDDPKLIRSVTSEDIEKNVPQEGEDSSHNWTPRPIKNLTDMWKAKAQHYENGQVTFADTEGKTANYIHGKNATDAAKRFRNHFKFEENEQLISTYYGHLTKNIPVYGKFYLSSTNVCFRSLIPGSNTTMILPIANIDTCYKQKSFRFSYFGLVIVIRGHEELFLEFYTGDARNDMETLLLKMIADIADATTSTSAVTKNDAIVSTDAFIENNTNTAKLKFFEDKISAGGFNVPLLFDQNPNVTVNIKPNRNYNIGLITIGSRGDVQPYIALGQGLIKEGHTVTIITHAEFKDFVEENGIKFKSIAGNPAELMALMVEHESMSIGMLREASKKFGGWIKELLSTSWDACKDQNFDIIIESPSCIAGIHIAEALRVAYFRAFTMPWTRTRAYPHAFVVPDKKRGGNYNYMSYVLFENVYWRGTSAAINKWRVDSLGLGKTSLEQLQQNKVPFLYNVSPTIFPPSVDFNEWVKVTGYWFLDQKSNYSPPQELVSFINKSRENKKKLVYIGFGSIVVSNASEMTQCIVDAVKKADVYCILNKGWSERLGDKSAKTIDIELPECIFNAGNVPHDWLFPQLDGAVHHGGSGTTGATLRAGLPTIIRPFFGDQFFYANRVEEIGVGVALRKFNSKALTNALVEITTKDRYKERALLIKKRINKENGVKTAINCIYGELEYARSLIYAKNPSGSSHKEAENTQAALEDDDNIQDIPQKAYNVVPISPSTVEDPWVLL